jgi:SSS family solute:Na+ symporter
MLVIGKYKPRAEAYELSYSKQVDITPWKHVNSIGIGIFIMVLVIYIYFI